MRVEWRKGDKFKHHLWGKFTRCSNNSFGSLGEGRGRAKDDPHFCPGRQGEQWANACSRDGGKGQVYGGCGEFGLGYVEFEVILASHSK